MDYLIVVWAVFIGIWLLAVALFDLYSRRIPNYLVLVGTVAVITGAIYFNYAHQALLGGSILFGVYLFTRLFRDDIGGGDIKVAFPLGALAGMCGYNAWIVAALGALFTTALVGLILHKIKKYRSSANTEGAIKPIGLPHGTFMSLWTGGILVVAWLFT